MTKSSDIKSELVKGTLQDRIKVLVNICVTAHQEAFLGFHSPHRPQTAAMPPLRSAMCSIFLTSFS